METIILLSLISLFGWGSVLYFYFSDKKKSKSLQHDK